MRFTKLLIVVSASLVLTAACSPASTPPVASGTPQPASQGGTSKEITTEDLKKLRWIEGSWRGTGGGVEPFYERYKFENDSTLAVETLTDETLSKVDDVSRFELKNGSFGGSDGESGSVAISLDETSITFAPLGKAQNAFRWQRENDNSWKAILTWTDKDGAPKERIYIMERWPATR